MINSVIMNDELCTKQDESCIQSHELFKEARVKNGAQMEWNSNEMEETIEGNRSHCQFHRHTFQGQFLHSFWICRKLRGKWPFNEKSLTHGGESFEVIVAGGEPTARAFALIHGVIAAHLRRSQYKKKRKVRRF